MNSHSNKGFSLVELMISSFISVIILAGVIHLTLASSAGYVFQNQIAQIQENLRFTINEISTQTKNSHIYPLGCDKNTKIANVIWSESIVSTPINNMGLGLNVLNALEDSEYVYERLNNAFIGSDILTIGLLNTKIKYKSNTHFKSTRTWRLDTLQERPKDSLMLVITPDCLQASVFLADFNNTADATDEKYINEVMIKPIGRVDQGMQNCSHYVFGDFYCVSNNPVNLNGYQLPEINIDNSVLYPVLQNYYYVAPSTQKDNQGEYYPALYRNNQELVQGVETLNVTLGLDTDGDNVPNQYVKNNQINAKQWINVKSIRVKLTMRSLERVPSINGLDEDGYIRKDFTQTIHLRN